MGKTNQRVVITSILCSKTADPKEQCLPIACFRHNASGTTANGDAKSSQAKDADNSYRRVVVFKVLLGLALRTLRIGERWAASTIEHVRMTMQLRHRGRARLLLLDDVGISCFQYRFPFP
jgi:hypothetical protein